MRKILILFISIAVFALSSCGTVGKKGSGGDLATLKQWMIGDFSNSSSLENPSRNAIEEHRPIVVHLRPLPNIKNGLYIEQALSTASERPYRQRVYILKQDGARFISEVYTLKNPEEFINAHRDENKLAEITAAEIELKTGCEVVLYWNGEQFTGGTEGRDCETNLYDSVYATAQVTVFEDGFSSLDRGWNADDEQVWGAEKLPYLFLRN